ncbi:MAG: NAD-dependent deacylase, partial [Cytophagales bacterium]|nr:NAD-dependent deacylase [Cytophaga sp.]
SDAEPNAAHKALTALEKKYKVSIITQNVDNLHERAGSANVLHLHGELFKSRSTINPRLIYDMKGWELNIGDKCEKGSQLRPNIVWFGEAVPLMQTAASITHTADIFMVIGTSLQVYPAAGLLDDVPETAAIYLIDPNVPDIWNQKNITILAEKASTGVVKVVEKLLKE